MNTLSDRRDACRSARQALFAALQPAEPPPDIWVSGTAASPEVIILTLSAKAAKERLGADPAIPPSVRELRDDLARQQIEAEVIGSPTTQTLAIALSSVSDAYLLASYILTR
ncbi:hypothetical protein ACH4VR_36450 [Streptomyces sp. NPDC020883]|uniref:hypothetical protein n=1 Tax=Streptomyces sp. NPDC020883 TaxID=3365099 RepID=UPI0037929905